jgi:hypothetical protein
MRVPLRAVGRLDAHHRSRKKAIPIRRRSIRGSTALIVGLLLALTGCTASQPPSAAETAAPSAQPESAVVLADRGADVREVLAGPPAGASLATSRSLFEQSPVAVVVADAGDATAPALGVAATAAVGLGVPLLTVDPQVPVPEPVIEELDRLGVRTIIAYGDPTADWAGLGADRELLAGPVTADGFSSGLGLRASEQMVPAADLVAAIGSLDPARLTLVTVEAPQDPASGSTSASSTGPEGGAGLEGIATTDTLPAITAPEGHADALVLATEASPAASVATARAAQADVTILADGDPRSTPAGVSAVHAHADGPVYGIGADFGDAAGFAAHVEVAATGVELPGGGQTVFPGRRMVALYGHPSGPYLGALGEQGIDATMDRVKQLAAQYQPFSDEPVIPALDLIATVASGEPGPDGDYSGETPVEVLVPWVDAAEKAGVYVVLDFQSGRTDFLSQVTRYEELLARPSVGLALDPEWRLAPGQRPLEQIGTVGAGEINASSRWLADLTRDRALPQKLFMVHQFRLDMISDRDTLDTSRSELAVTLHADGHGTPGEKLETWAVLQDAMPAGVWPSWKNFYDEDRPMLTPEQTYSLVAPRPWLVTYQ